MLYNNRLNPGYIVLCGVLLSPIPVPSILSSEPALGYMGP